MNKLWKYAVIVADTNGNLYVKDGDHRAATHDDALNYAASQTTGKIRGLMSKDDVICVFDMTNAAINSDPAFDPNLTDEHYRRGYDNYIRKYMPLKRKLIENFRGQKSLELHPIPKSYTNQDNWREKLKKEWLAIHRNLSRGYSSLSTDYIPRFGQDTAIDEAVYKLKTLDQTLLAAYTAFGKTITGLEIAHRVISAGGLVLVTTPVTDTIDGFKEGLDPLTGMRFGNDPTRKTTYISKTDFLNFKGTAHAFAKQLRKRADAGELIFILLTVQDLRYQDQKQRKDIRKKYKALSGKLDLWIRDERHTEYEGEVTSEAFSQIDSKMVLDLTATPYSIADRYSQEHIVDRSLLWAIKNRSNTKIPRILIDIMSTAFEYLPKDLQVSYDIEEGWNPKKFFESVRTKSGISFSQIRGITELFNKSYIDTKSKKKNPLTIANDMICETAKEVGLWVLPHGNGDIGSAEYLPILAEILDAISDQILVIDSYTLGKKAKQNGQTIGDCVEELKQNHRIVILTCEKFLTGTNIPSLGHIVLLRSIGNISQFEQLIGREVRIYKPDENNGGFGIKPEVKLYNYCPDMEVKNTIAKWAASASTINPTIDPTEFLDCISVTEYNNGKANPVDASAIIKVYQDNMKNISGPPLYSIENAISTSGASGFFNGVDLLKGNKGPTVKVSEDNGSKVKEPKKTPKKPHLPISSKINDKSVAENINVILKESLPFAYSHNVWTPVDILQLPELALLIEAGNITALLNAIKFDAKLESYLRDWYTKVKISIHQLPIEDVYDKIFVNSKLKAKIGLVYVPFKMAHKIVNKLQKDKYNRILILNALSGTLAIAAREKYPNAEIICAEVFDYFIPHLKRLEFTVVKWDNREMNKMKKFDVRLGNPPYQNGKNPNFWQAILDELWEKTDSELDAFITPNFLTSTSKSFSVPGLYYYKDLGHPFEGVNQPAGMCMFFATQHDSSKQLTIEDINGNQAQSDFIVTDANMVGIINKVISNSQKTLRNRYFRGELNNQSDPTGISYIRKVGENKKEFVLDKFNQSGFPKYFKSLSKKWFVVFSYNASGGPTDHGNKKIGPLKLSIPGKPFGYSVCGLGFDSESEANHCINVLNSTLFKKIVSTIKYATNNSKRLFNMLPEVDLSRIWTDEELYEHFNLTREEIDYIENNVK